MTYEEFIELFKGRAASDLSYDPALMEFYPEGYTSEDPKVLEWIMDCNKRYTDEAATWLKKDFLILKEDAGEKVSVSQRVAIHDLYLDAEKRGFDAAFEEVRKSRATIQSSNIQDAVNMRSNASYEGIRDQLIIRPLNYSLHIDELRGTVYRRTGDIALVLYQLMGNAEMSLMSSKISREELKRWGMDGQADKVIDEALANTARLFPASTYNYSKNEEVDFLAAEFTREDITVEKNTIMISTFKVTNGAAALFYPGVVEKMMKVMGGAFWAVFMNINDIMIFSRGDRRAESCTRAAKTGGGQAEMLSSRIYLCSEQGVNPA